MKRSLTVFICFFALTLSSQSIIEIGTKWTYTWRDFGYHQPTYIEIVDDTIIEGMKWFKHEGVGGCAGAYRDVLIRESESKVFMLDMVTNSEEVLYDYTKTTGESWVIPIGPTVDYVINVDSVGTINIDGVEYNVQYIDNIEFGSLIIEGIGCYKYFFPQGNICDLHYGGIRCFSSDNLEIDFDTTHTCDATYIVPPVSTNNTPKEIVVNIFPNPTLATLRIEHLKGLPIQQIDVCAFGGNILHSVKGRVGKESYEIDLIDFTPGIYLIRIVSNGNEFVEKIIKL